MASTLHKIGFTALRCSYRKPARRKALPLASHIRQFHCTPLYRARKENADENKEDADEEASHEPPPGAVRQTFNFNLKDLPPEERKRYDSLTPSEQAEWREEMRQIHEAFNRPEYMQQLTGEVSKAASEPLVPPFDPPTERFKPGLMAMGEDEPEDIGEDPEFEGDDITALAHGELEQHREMREYARIAVWEMPLLNKLAKPFEPPTAAQPLRFRYTTYMGETHPAAKKIVCEFCTHDIAATASLTEAQRIKLIKLAGVRYNPDTDTVKMSSEMFETPAQNKRYLGDLVDTLIKEAKDSEDMFEDVPLDFRHHRPKKKWGFPEEWKLDREKRGRLVEERERREGLERERRESGRLVEGRQVVREALRALPVRDESRVLVEQQQGKRRGPKLR